MQVNMESGTTARILIIEDEPAILSLMESTLKARGYEVETASDGLEGLRKTFQTVPDLVLTDITMPKLSGLDYVQKTRAVLPAGRLPIIIVSALGLENQIMDGFTRGATDYVVKPFRWPELLAKIQIALGHKVDPANISIDKACFIENQSRHVPTPAAGHVLDMGKYRIEEEIGSGGMGTVYKAKHVGYGIDVALKVLNPEFAKDKTYAFRFLREVKIASQLNHPNIVKVFDIGLNGDVLFYAMEYVPGSGLNSMLGRAGAVPERDLIGIGLQISSALAYMHAKGFVHRDVKPDNLIRCADGGLKLIDFGLAAAVNEKRLTKEGTFLGTPGYVAPENVRHYRAPSELGDIYSAGATLYALATGSPPYDEYSDPMGKLVAQVKVALKPASAANPAISAGLSGVIGRMTERRHTARFKDMKEVQSALEGLLPSGMKAAS